MRSTPGLGRKINSLICRAVDDDEKKRKSFITSTIGRVQQQNRRRQQRRRRQSLQRKRRQRRRRIQRFGAEIRRRKRSEEVPLRWRIERSWEPAVVCQKSPEGAEPKAAPKFGRTKKPRQYLLHECCAPVFRVSWEKAGAVNIVLAAFDPKPLGLITFFEIFSHRKFVL